MQSASFSSPNYVTGYYLPPLQTALKLAFGLLLGCWIISFIRNDTVRGIVATYYSLPISLSVTSNVTPCDREQDMILFTIELSNRVRFRQWITGRHLHTAEFFVKMQAHLSSDARKSSGVVFTRPSDRVYYDLGLLSVYICPPKSLLVSAQLLLETGSLQI